MTKVPEFDDPNPRRMVTVPARSLLSRPLPSSADEIESLRRALNKMHGRCQKQREVIKGLHAERKLHEEEAADLRAEIEAQAALQSVAVASSGATSLLVGAAETAWLRAERTRLEDALREIRDLAADRERFVREGPRGFARALRVVDEALAPREPVVTITVER